MPLFLRLYLDCGMACTPFFHLSFYAVSFSTLGAVTFSVDVGETVGDVHGSCTLGDDVRFVEVVVGIGVGVGIGSAVFSVFEFFSNSFRVISPASNDGVVEDGG